MDDLAELGLNYRLALVDGCSSAQTSTISIDDAQESDSLTPEAVEFARTFGEDVAYLGWGWAMRPSSSQIWIAEFLSYLKGGRTVQEAFDLFRAKTDAEHSARFLLKLFGKGENHIDLKTIPKNDVSI